MSRRDATDLPSPILSVDQINRALLDGLESLGAMGGAIGGQIGGGLPGGRGGESGGRIGARVGTKLFTRLDGAQRVLTVPRTAQTLQNVRLRFFKGVVDERMTAPPETRTNVVTMVGVVGSGAAGMNPCVVQVVWFDQQLQATAHAREGLIKQRTCSRALQALADSVGRA